ncbi:MAG TPA: hypothetical protein VGQ39_06460 [Pyrinomonadaceae bacterium]|jgi:tetratricopeptide (TPR) repeat protein|nr:hypothetical protein [Pyrinomonadaceae bacterium]
MNKTYTFVFVASILLCLAPGCSNVFKRYKCTSTVVVSPKSAEDYIRIALDHGSRREFDCGYGACDEAVRLEPKNPKAYYCRALNTLSDEAALRDLARAIELDPHEIDSYDYRSRIYKRNDDPDRAVKDLEMIVKVCQGKCDQLYLAEVHRRLGEFYMNRKDYETAALDYTESVRLAPESVVSYKGREAANRKLERHELADADVVKAVELEGAQFGAKTPEMIELGILNYRATSLAQPPYPDLPVHLRKSGDVEIAVEVSETGQVLKAWGQYGNSWLYDTAVPAAERVRFKPLIINGKAAKFTGRLRYTFTAPK